MGEINGSFMVGKGSQIGSYIVNKSELRGFEMRTDSLKSLLKKTDLKEQDIL